MTNATSTQAGIQAVADAPRLHDGAGILAYPWHLETSRPGSQMTPTAIVTNAKFHHRWPQEISP